MMPPGYSPYQALRGQMVTNAGAEYFRMIVVTSICEAGPKHE